MYEYDTYQHILHTMHLKIYHMTMSICKKDILLSWFLETKLISRSTLHVYFSRLSICKSARLWDLFLNLRISPYLSMVPILFVESVRKEKSIIFLKWKFLFPKLNFGHGAEVSSIVKLRYSVTEILLLLLFLWLW